jgi:hypothetical protein
MASNLDIYRSAKLLIDQHGDEAPIHAAMMVDELREAGDMDGRATWWRILRAIDELRRTEPGAARGCSEEAACVETNRNATQNATQRPTD